MLPTFKHYYMKKKRFLVDHPSQLNALSVLPWLHSAGLGRIVFADTYVNDNKQQMEMILNKSYHACGCSEGAKALLLGLITFSIAGMAGYFYASWTWPQTISTIAGGTVLMSLLGKFTGLLLANRKLKKTIREIQSDWNPQWPDSKDIGCG